MIGRRFSPRNCENLKMSQINQRFLKTVLTLPSRLVPYAGASQTFTVIDQKIMVGYRIGQDYPMRHPYKKYAENSCGD